MTRAEFTEEILAALGGRLSSDETISLTVSAASYNLVHKWIKRAERRIVSKHDFRYMHQIVTVSNTGADYIIVESSLGTVKSIQGVRVIDGTSSYEVVYKPPMWFNMNRPYPTGFAPGKPEFYTIAPIDSADYVLAKLQAIVAGQKVLYFYPTPDGTVATPRVFYIDITRWPLEMANDSTNSTLGVELEQVVIEYALALGFSHFGEAYKKDADFHSKLGDKYLEEAIAADDYVPAYRVVPDGYAVTRKWRYRHWDIDSGGFPSGTVNPWR